MMGGLRDRSVGAARVDLCAAPLVTGSSTESRSFFLDEPAQGTGRQNLRSSGLGIRRHAALLRRGWRWRQKSTCLIRRRSTGWRTRAPSPKKRSTPTSTTPPPSNHLSIRRLWRPPLRHWWPSRRPSARIAPSGIPESRAPTILGSPTNHGLTPHWHATARPWRSGGMSGRSSARLCGNQARSPSCPSTWRASRRQCSTRTSPRGLTLRPSSPSNGRYH